MKKNLFLLLILIFLTSCGSAGFTLKKETSSDEFLVEKKSHLAQPPEYGKLPLPDLGIDGNSPQKETKLKSLNVGNSNNSTTKIEKNSKSSSIEKSILEKIK